MDVLNRAAVTAAAGAVMICAVAALLVASGALDHRFPPWIPEPGGKGWLEPELRSLSQLDFRERAAAVCAAAAAAALAGLVLFMETRRKREKGAGGLLLVSDAEEGITTVEAGSVQAIAEAAGSAVTQVSRASCRVRRLKPGYLRGPDRVEIICRPRLSMGASLERARDGLQREIKAAVESHTGLSVERVHVSGARFSPLPRGRLLDSPQMGK